VIAVDLNREMVGDVLVVTPKGDYLDASNIKDFKREMTPLIESHHKIIMDLGHVQLVDSSGCGAFISFLRQLKAKDGDMKLCAITRPVRALFELVRMHRIFDIFNTRDEAVKAFKV
jgi:anti-sigma B factor antagonist